MEEWGRSQAAARPLGALVGPKLEPNLSLGWSGLWSKRKTGRFSPQWRLDRGLERRGTSEAGRRGGGASASLARGAGLTPGLGQPPAPTAAGLWPTRVPAHPSPPADLRVPGLSPSRFFRVSVAVSSLFVVSVCVRSVSFLPPFPQPCSFC